MRSCGGLAGEPFDFEESRRAGRAESREQKQGSGTKRSFVVKREKSTAKGIVEV